MKAWARGADRSEAQAGDRPAFAVLQSGGTMNHLDSAASRPVAGIEVVLADPQQARSSPAAWAGWRGSPAQSALHGSRFGASTQPRHGCLLPAPRRPRKAVQIGRHRRQPQARRAGQHPAAPELALGAGRSRRRLTDRTWTARSCPMRTLPRKIYSMREFSAGSLDMRHESSSPNGHDGCTTPI